MFCSLLIGSLLALTPVVNDSSKTLDMEEIVVTATNKQTSKVRNTATSASLISHEEIESRRIGELSDLNALVPNFFMPKYGSRLSSALYIRGIGSRINTPAVALYVDDAPVADKSEYTTDLLNIDRIDVLKGPQGTLYGRNAMGGILRIYTQNPFYRQGTDIKVSGATRNNAFSISGTTNQRLSDKLAFSLGGFYKTDEGFYHNDSLGKKVGGSDAFGFNARLLYRPSQHWNLDWNNSYEYSDEDGYPYFYGGQVKGDEIPNALDRITSNRQSKYRRSVFSTNFKASWEGKPFIFNAVTSFRNLGDRMLMDQDFTYKDYFTLEQKQKGNTLSEEITLKSKPGKRWEWTGGAFGLYEALRTSSPVVFYQDGVDMLNSTLAQSLPTITYNYNGRPISMPLSLKFSDPSFTVDGHYRTPTLNGALFFQNTLHDFLFPRFSLTLGLRMDYEHQQLSYRGFTSNVDYVFSMQMIQPANLTATPSINGKLKNDHTSLLPKIALQYDLPNHVGNIYATVSKGQRSGGYNIQMFSDIMSSVLQNSMMQGTKDYCDGVLQNNIDNARTEALKQMFTGIKQTVDENIPIQANPDIASIAYKPEQCWNYEAGTHLNLLDNKLTADLSAFFMDVRNQQISRMVNSGLGRIMVNAGESHTCGLEMTLTGRLLNDRLTLRGNYGYTHAEFHKYDAGTTDYTGNFVPFIPEHNASLSADYGILVNQGGLVKNLTLGVQGNGMGRIYWNEENTAWQNFYATLNGHVMVDLGSVDVTLWANNITCSQYNAFYFESSNRKYYQKGTPFQMGLDLHWRF